MGGGAKKIKKVAKNITKGVGNVIEATIEKPIKKVGKEGFDIIAGTTDEERRAMLGEAPETTPEVTPEVVPDETLMASKERKRSKSKKLGGAGTIMEGYGVAYATPSSKAPTGGSA